MLTRIIEIPFYSQDPWTHETLMRFRERHQDPNGTDLEYAARINGYDTVEAFIEAHHSQPWFVSMVGFVAGLPFLYQLVEREKQLQVPKYLRPRTDTPKLTVGYGGCFSCIYSVRGAGGYQMFGVTPMPIYDPEQTWNGYNVLSILDTPLVVVLDMNGNVVKQWDGFNLSPGGPARVIPGGNVLGTAGANPPHQEALALVQQDFEGKETWGFDASEEITLGDRKRAG